MSIKVYEKYGYAVLKSRDGWIAYNTAKPFQQGHTHLTSYRSAKDIIKFCWEQRVPMKGNTYYLVGLQRLTKYQNYYNKLQDRIDEVNEKGRYC